MTIIIYCYKIIIIIIIIKECLFSAIHHLAYGENGCHFNNIPLSRVNSKIRNGSISEINQCGKSNIFTKYDAFNPKRKIR